MRSEVRIEHKWFKTEVKWSKSDANCGNNRAKGRTENSARTIHAMINLSIFHQFRVKNSKKYPQKIRDNSREHVEKARTR